MEDVNGFDELYHKIQELLKTQQRKIRILEEQIDVELQMDYFKNASQLRKIINKNVVEARSEELFSAEVPIEEKKQLLKLLAKVDTPKAFQAIKEYKESPDKELAQWSVLAYQESQMILESNLLDEAPMFISTGLGGKRDKLRFSLAVLANDEVFKDWQKELVEKELEYVLKSYDGELEEISHWEDKTIAGFLLPLTHNVRLLIDKVVNNCNELGHFLSEHYIITNAHKLTNEDVNRLVAIQKQVHKSKEE